MSTEKITTETSPRDTYQKVEHFFMKNRKTITAILIGIAIGIAGYIGYKKLYLAPKEEQALNKISVPQSFFAADSLNLALNGNGVDAGFLQIINQYGKTKSGNLAKYYAGTCYLKQKDYDNAIKYLSDFNPPTDELSGLKLMQLGHAYSEKNDFTKAIASYREAGETAHSDIYSPYYYKLAGDLMSMQKDYKGAKEVYEIIKKNYPLSEEGVAIDKDIAFTATKLGE